jgi:hypothetical protein
VAVSGDDSTDDLGDVLGGIGEVASREQLTGLVEQYSGSHLERVGLANGQRLVLKWLPTVGDWVTAATDGLGRTERLWSAGILDCAGSVVDHAVLRVAAAPGGTVVVMRDMTDHMWRPGTRMSRSESRRHLAGLARVHAAWRAAPVDGLCAVGARYSMFAPAFHAAFQGHGAHPAAPVIAEGWKVFFKHAPADVGEAIAAIHRDPTLLDRAIGETRLCLLHGDAKLANMGLTSSGTILLDWGELTGFGPPEVDLAWYLLQNAPHINASREALISDYEEAAGERLNPLVLATVFIGSLAQLGFRMAFVSNTSPDATTRARAAKDLKWWVDRAQEALRLSQVSLP